MSPRKRTSKKRATKKRPTKAMLKEISEVFERHKWAGVIIRLSDSESIGELNALTEDVGDGNLGLAPTRESLKCTPPEKPRYDCIKKSDGTIVCGWYCE